MKIIVFITALSIFAFSFAACGKSGKNSGFFTGSGDTEKSVSSDEGDCGYLSAVEYLERAEEVFSAQTNYKSVMNGEVTAKVLGFPYEQKIYNRRDFSDGKLLVLASSKSAIVNVAEERYYGADSVRIRRQTSASEINGDDTVWEGAPEELSKGDYIEKYGLYPAKTTDYVINAETVLSAVKETFADGVTAVNVSLDPDKATEYYKRQVKTMASSGSYPVFKTVALAFYTDAYDRVTRVEINETYDIKKIGNLTCTAYMT
ncbi:MAG: hypothetical protein J6Z34_00480, partial [Clostridia bacterium]|nr:hypothetical protein [Clostridia bacterium]